MNEPKRSSSHLERKRLTGPSDRKHARQVRNAHWSILEKIHRLGTVYICPWNKNRLAEQDDEVRFALLEWNEFAAWVVERHGDWVDIGEWDQERQARPFSLTAAGRKALREKHRYDAEPVHGGLVEPGWACVPLPARA